MNNYMRINDKKLYQFCKCTDGNWRNSIFIEGQCDNCAEKEKDSSRLLYTEHCPPEVYHCKDFLVAVSEAGTPIMAPCKYIEYLSGETLDASECAGMVSLPEFEALFNYWKMYNVDSSSKCPLFY